MTRIKSTAQLVSGAASDGSGGKGDGSEERTISEHRAMRARKVMVAMLEPKIPAHGAFILDPQL
jgi:hypothetical protein